MWKFVSALPLFLLFPAVVELTASSTSTVVRTSKEFCSALYDTRIVLIYLKDPLILSGKDWGLVRPDIKRRVEIRPLDHIEGEFVLDLGGGTDLAFVSGPSGEVHFHDLQLRGMYRLALGGSGSVGIMNLFRVNSPQSIHIHNSICCFPPEVCTSISNDMRLIVSSSKAALSALDIDSCPFPDPQEPFYTYKYHEGCVLPQEWDASKTTGSIHFHNTSLSCADKCMVNAQPLDLPVVQVSTADSRQVVAAIGGMISDPQILEMRILGRVVVYEHQWSNPFTIVARGGTKMSIDGLLEDGSHATLAFLTNGVLMKVVGVFTLHLANLKLELESFGPGFLSKTDWKFQFCDGEEYFYKWPLFLPYPFALEDSSVQIANVSISYRTCPSNLDFERFIASLNDLKEHFVNTDYGNLTIDRPSFSINKHVEGGIVFDEFNISLPAFLGHGASWSPVLLNHFELHNVTVVCDSFGEPIDENRRCFGDKGSPSSDEEEENANKTEDTASWASSVDLWRALALPAMFCVGVWL